VHSCNLSRSAVHHALAVVRLTETNMAAKFCNETQKKLSRPIRQYSDDKKMNMRPIDPRSVMGDVIHVHDYRGAAEE
jgi:hypothetical protein